LKEKYKQSFAPIEELKGIVSDEEEEAFEDDDVKVTIRNIEPDKALRKHNFLGLRQFDESSDEEEKSGEKEKNQINLDEIEGMEINKKKKSKSTNQNEEQQKSGKKKLPLIPENIKSEKDFKRMVCIHVCFKILIHLFIFVFNYFSLKNKRQRR
jgi:hypothetical protein